MLVNKTSREGPYLVRTDTCAVTGKKGLDSELTKSAVSGKPALPSAIVRCEVTNEPALPGELGFCSVSGKRVLPRLLVQSAQSGRYALPDFTTSCAVCGKTSLSSELTACADTGRLADPTCLNRCAVSDKLVLPGLLAKCDATGRGVRVSELAECRDGETQRRVAKDCVTTCAYTGRLIGKDRSAVSSVTGKVGWVGVLSSSDASGAIAHGDEMVRSVTGKLVLPSEVSVCPGCGGRALLEPPHAEEAFACGSCHQVVCVKDVAPDGRTCRACHAALSGSGEDRAPPIYDAPRAKRWSTAAANAYLVALSYPPAWQLLAKPRLYVTTPSGHLLFDRTPSKTELTAA